MSEIQHYQNYINGEFVESLGPRIEVTNPATGEVLASIPDSGAEQVDSAVAAARAAQRDWARRQR